MNSHSTLHLDAAKKKSASARANKKLNCTVGQCGGRCLRAGETCRLAPTKAQKEIWGAANKAAKKSKAATPESSTTKKTRSKPKQEKQEIPDWQKEWISPNKKRQKQIEAGTYKPKKISEKQRQKEEAEMKKKQEEAKEYGKYLDKYYEWRINELMGYELEET